MLIFIVKALLLKIERAVIREIMKPEDDDNHTEDGKGLKLFKVTEKTEKISHQHLLDCIAQRRPHKVARKIRCLLTHQQQPALLWTKSLRADSQL